jgi:hypothetical protein
VDILRHFLTPSYSGLRFLYFKQVSLETLRNHLAGLCTHKQKLRIKYISLEFSEESILEDKVTEFCWSFCKVFASSLEHLAFLGNLFYTN